MKTPRKLWTSRSRHYALLACFLGFLSLGKLVITGCYAQATHLPGFTAVDPQDKLDNGGVRVRQNKGFAEVSLPTTVEGPGGLNVPVIWSSAGAPAAKTELTTSGSSSVLKISNLQSAYEHVTIRGTYRTTGGREEIVNYYIPVYRAAN